MTSFVLLKVSDCKLNQEASVPVDGQVHSRQRGLRSGLVPREFSTLNFQRWFASKLIVGVGSLVLDNQILLDSLHTRKNLTDGLELKRKHEEDESQELKKRKRREHDRQSESLEDGVEDKSEGCV